MTRASMETARAEPPGKPYFQTLAYPPSPPGSVLEPRARSARFPVYPPSVERPPAVERNAGGQWCADAEYSACMYETYT